MSALPKMKPCPLCGHDEHLAVYTYDRGGTHVECSTRCGYLGPACTGVRWAIRHHNQRRDETARRHIASLVAGATAAEAERDALKAEVERLRKADRACQWYWPENSTESENCADSPQEVVQNAYGWEEPRGDVVAVARGGVVEVTYCAALPPAPDSDSDDEFWVEEATEEAAASKITAELERRAALSPAKAGG